MTDTRPDVFFQIGGTLKADAPSYIERSADQELLQCVNAGEFAYVLTPRQMGKSSLMTRTAQTLRDNGIHVAIIDLTGIGGDAGSMNADAWYYGLAHTMLRELNVEFELYQWWTDQTMLPPLKRLMMFFEDVVLALVPGNIVVFVDEIDTTINLPFSDDFFAAIRACFNARAKQAEFDRLCFVLLGVASPADLIRDPTRTPFNIGKRIELSDFNQQQTQHFIQGLPNHHANKNDLLDRLLYWTNGHPYLTQKLGSLISSSLDTKTQPHELVDDLVKTEFFGKGRRSQEDNLKLIDDRINKAGTYRNDLLKLYSKIRKDRKTQDLPQSATHSLLKLSGLVKVDENGKLVVRNRIYQHVFDSQWVKQSRPVPWRQRTSIISIIVLIAGLSWWIGQQQLTWQSATSIVLAALDIAYPEPEMVIIPSGTFLMGSLETEHGDSDEKPQHQVTLKQDFYLGKYEVTFDEYEVFVFLQKLSGECLNADGKQYAVSRPTDFGWERDNRPVIAVSWFDARCYAQWLSRKTGKNYRLPTEAEWEYAARARTTGTFYWGEADSNDYAWSWKNSGSETHPVGEKLPNTFGLYDMSGNVWEWVHDCWHENYHNAPDDGSAREQVKGRDCTFRVLRGGSWLTYPWYVRSAFRYWVMPHNRFNYVGFRLAQDLP